MKNWHVAALIIGILIAIQLVVLSIYFLVDDDTREYRRDVSISVEWREGANRTVENYTVLVPLLVHVGTGEDALTSLEDLEVTLGRGYLEIIRMEDTPYLKITSDTAIRIVHHHALSGEQIVPDSEKVEFAMQGGDIDEGTASLLIESDTDQISVEIESRQESVSSSGERRIVWAICDVELNEGSSRYPLTRYDP